MKKRFWRKLLAVAMAATTMILACTACGSTGQTQEETPAQETPGEETAGENTESGEMPNLVVSYAYAKVPADIDKIEAALSEMTQEKIGCTVTLEAFTYGNINDQLTLILSSPSEQLDVMFGRFFGTGISGYVSKGQLIGLNDLLDEYGQGIKEVIGQDYLDAASIDGEVYGITTCRDLGAQNAFLFRKDIIDELGIDLSGVKSYEDLTPIFAQIHEAHPELYVTGASATQSPFFVKQFKNVDFLADRLGVLMDYHEPVVSNLFESQDFRDLVELTTEWNQAGYIYPDITTDSSNSVQMLLSNGLAASYMQSYKPGAIVENQNTVQNYELVAAVIDKPVVFTMIVQSWMWTIPTNSKYPEKAMELMNLLYTDEEVVNLLSYGIEGEHYVVTEDGFASDGPQSAGYADKAAWKAGNAYLAHVWKGDDADLYEQLKAFNDSADKTCAMGFVMDNSSVSAEYTALQSVLAQYETLLEWGFAGDIDATIEEFNQALYKAGLQAYMDEKQRQLDEFLGK